MGAPCITMAPPCITAVLPLPETWDLNSHVSHHHSQQPCSHVSEHPQDLSFEKLHRISPHHSQKCNGQALEWNYDVQNSALNLNQEKEVQIAFSQFTSTQHGLLHSHNPMYTHQADQKPREETRQEIFK